MGRSVRGDRSSANQTGRCLCVHKQIVKWSTMRDSHPRYFRPKRNAIAARRMMDKIVGEGTTSSRQCACNLTAHLLKRHQLEAGVGIEPTIPCGELMRLYSVPWLVPAMKVFRVPLSRLLAFRLPTFVNEPPNRSMERCPWWLGHSSVSRKMVHRKGLAPPVEDLITSSA